MSEKYRRSLWLCSTAALFVASTTAMADEASKQVAPADIIVTANRTATSQQKTSIALNVYGGEELQERNITNLNALQLIDPSLQITNSTGSAYVGIRGVQSSNVTEVGNPSVSVARDGFFTNRPVTLGLAFYDLARIEVLKGPQGTLFGRNSTGGLINIISAKPKLGSIEGYVSGVAGNYSLYGGEGGINIPISSTLAVRLSAFGRHRDGYREVTGVNIRGDDDKSASVRAQAYWKPSESFDLLVGYQHDKQRGTGDVQAIGVIGSIFTGNPKRFLGYQPTVTRNDVDRITWTANIYDLPLDGTLTYTGGYDMTKAYRINDTSGTNPAGTFLVAQFESKQRVKTVNHEIRFATSDQNRFFFQVGGFYFKEHNAPVTSGQILRTAPYDGQFLVRFQYDVESVSKAAFGQAGFRITPNIKLTAGGRYSWDTVQRLGSSALRCDVAGIPAFLFSGFGCGGTPPTQVTPANGVQSSNKFTYRFGVDWDVSPVNLLYAKYDTGYKPGGFSTDPVRPDSQFGPETVSAFEIGSKNRFLDNKLVLNADVFYQTLDGFQAALPSALGGGTVNAGKTYTYGAEVFVQAVLTRTTRIDVSGTYLHARFAKNLAPVDDGNRGSVDISGRRLPTAPDLVFAGGVEQDVELGSGKLTFRLDGRYSSRVYFDFINRTDTSAPPTAIGNFGVTYSQDSWQLRAYVNNFTDKLVYSRITRTGLVSSQTFQFQAPRTAGVQATYRF